MSLHSSKQSLSSLVGLAIFLGGMQFSIGSVEMSSRFSVENFGTDQKTLQNAANALSTYFVIGLFWTLATCLVLYADHGMTGIIWGLIMNFMFMGWIVISYYLTFKRTAKNNGLNVPKLFHFGYASSRQQISSE